MKLWMDVMRDLESVMNDHERILDAWAEGGVDGVVVRVHSSSARQNYRKMQCPLPPTTSWRKRTIQIRRCTRDSESSRHRRRSTNYPRKEPC